MGIENGKSLPCFCKYVFNREMGYEWPANSHIMTSLSWMIKRPKLYSLRCSIKIPTTTNARTSQRNLECALQYDGKDWGSVDTKDKPLDGHIVGYYTENENGEREHHKVGKAFGIYFGAMHLLGDTIRGTMGVQPEQNVTLSVKKV